MFSFKPNPKRIIVAFDIETSGPSYKKHKIMAIGMTAIDQDFNVIKMKRLNCYVPDFSMEYDKKTWKEYWSKHLDLLDEFIYTGKEDANVDEWAINEFQAFRKKMEALAKETGSQYNLVSDNNAYDSSFINESIMRYTKDKPIPYSATTGEYSSFFETHSMQKGFLLAADPFCVIDMEFGFSERMAELYELPPSLKQHDHLPENDAYTIAYDFNVMLKICEGLIKKKEILLA